MLLMQEDFQTTNETEKAEMSAKELGTEIERLRNLEGWSQHELAQRIELHQTGVSSMEMGRHTFPLETIYRLAYAFKINPFRLASIYWGIDMNDFSNREGKLLSNIIRLLDDYRTNTSELLPLLPPPPTTKRHQPDEQAQKGIEEAKAQRKKRKANKPAEDSTLNE